ncbi:hypothetical protein F0562_021741 [Nyssa sinensis]|uniref:Uncharacterized protein n=1 Tax=Nyssa sinensis TaxID=561372 RepID=A0A5J5BQT2_9ASTE|nr:hypothetical protein F0562_021741 [Nyssa sinensis]
MAITNATEPRKYGNAPKSFFSLFLGEETKLRMRFLVLALVLLLMSSCFAMDRTAYKPFRVEFHEHDHRRQLVENEKEKSEYSGGSNTVNNHHYIPRQDFNNYNGGTPKEGGDENDGNV